MAWIRTNADPVNWHMYAALGGEDEFIPIFHYDNTIVLLYVMYLNPE